jgi:hypothetical protein
VVVRVEFRGLELAVRGQELAEGSASPSPRSARLEPPSQSSENRIASSRINGAQNSRAILADE